MNTEEFSARPHVLLVEDSALLGDAFRIMLERGGFRVSVAASLAEANAVADQADLMLLDMSLPDGDGLTLLSSLAAKGRSPRVTVALTGRDDAGTRARCLGAGCADVLVKPVPMSDLLKRVRDLIDGAPSTAC